MHLSEFFYQFGHDLEQVADDTVVRDLENRRLLVLVDGDDHAAVLHSRQVLDRPRDADRDVQLRRDDFPRLPDLPVVGHETRVHRRARGTHRGVELVGERLENLEVLPGAHAAAAQERFAQIRDSNLKTARAWALKESLREWWGYRSLGWAKRFWRHWYFWATHSRLAPMIDVAKLIARHLPNVLTYFKHRITNAVAQGLNSKIATVQKRACGFRNRDHFKIAVYFHCGGLDLYPLSQI